MSLFFSITIITSAIRMLSAATSMIRPMMKAVTSFSSSQGVEQRLVALHPAHRG